MHHKRRRAKHQRAGCLLCHGHKRGGQDKAIRVKGLTAVRKRRELDRMLNAEKADAGV